MASSREATGLSVISESMSLMASSSVVGASAVVSIEVLKTKKAEDPKVPRKRKAYAL
jgi:hypothetical protein